MPGPLFTHEAREIHASGRCGLGLLPLLASLRKNADSAFRPGGPGPGGSRSPALARGCRRGRTCRGRNCRTLRRPKTPAPPMNGRTCNLVHGSRLGPWRSERLPLGAPGRSDADNLGNHLASESLTCTQRFRHPTSITCRLRQWPAEFAHLLLAGRRPASLEGSPLGQATWKVWVMTNWHWCSTIL